MFRLPPAAKVAGHFTLLDNQTVVRYLVRFMNRFIFTLALVFIWSGCGENAQSQQESRPPQRSSPTEWERAQVNVDESRQTAITRAVQAAAPAVVSINVTEVREYRDPIANDPFYEFFFGQGRPRVTEQEVKSMGSGFVISPDGYIVTNDHVAGNASKITVAFSDGSTLPATLIGSDRVTDVALIKVEPGSTQLPYLAFADSEQALPGEWVVALGNPFGLFDATEPSVTVGVISGVNRNLEPVEGRSYRGMIQTDAAINSGNSGGPLVNAIGELIGMNTVIYSRSGGSVGLGFAVAANKVQSIVNELKTSGKIERSIYTGLYVLDLNRRVAQQLGLPSLQGVLVNDIDENSPASEGGFRVNDVVLSISGERIRNRTEAGLLLAEYSPGDVVEVKIWRGGSERVLKLRLERQAS